MSRLSKRGVRKEDAYAEASSTVSLSVIVPVFNEGSTARQALQGLLDSMSTLDGVSSFEVIIVESNSTDGSRELVLAFAQDNPCTVILQDVARGKGHAVREGLAAASSDVILIFDADCEYDPNDIGALLVPILEGKTSFVLGSRHSESGMRNFPQAPVTAALMNSAHWVFAALINVVYGTRLRDPFTMYKVFRRKAIAGLEFTADRFDFDWELVGKLARAGCIPIEVPVKYESRHFSEGKKVRMIRDPISWMVALLKYRLSPLRRVES